MAAAFNAAPSSTGMSFVAEIVNDDVLQIVIDDREEFPVFVTVDDDQILCISNLWSSDEVKEGVVNDLNQLLLTLNIPVPLSAFAITRSGQYCIFGSLAPTSIIDNVIHEVETLSDNTVSAVEQFVDYLN